MHMYTVSAKPKPNSQTARVLPYLGSHLDNIQMPACAAAWLATSSSTLYQTRWDTERLHTGSGETRNINAAEWPHGTEAQRTKQQCTRAGASLYQDSEEVAAVTHAEIQSQIAGVCFCQSATLTEEPTRSWLHERIMSSKYRSTPTAQWVRTVARFLTVAMLTRAIPGMAIPWLWTWSCARVYTGIRGDACPVPKPCAQTTSTTARRPQWPWWPLWVGCRQEYKAKNTTVNSGLGNCLLLHWLRKIFARFTWHFEDWKMNNMWLATPKEQLLA